jgi:hypothetical protein
MSMWDTAPLEGERYEITSIHGGKFGNVFQLGGANYWAGEDGVWHRGRDWDDLDRIIYNDPREDWVRRV